MVWLQSKRSIGLGCILSEPGGCLDDLLCDLYVCVVAEELLPADADIWCALMHTLAHASCNALSM